MTPASRLHAAAQAIRDEWGTRSRGTAWHRERDFHLAVADLLEAISRDGQLSGRASEHPESLSTRAIRAVALAVADAINEGDTHE